MSGAREAGVGGDWPQRRGSSRSGCVLTFNRARRQDEWRQPSTKTDSETGEVWTYHYDALGNLLSVDLPEGRLIEYVIDGQNRRIGKRIDGVLTKAWLYKDQLKPIAELDGSGNLTARFIYGSKTNVPDVILRYAAGTVTRYRVISDHLGSPVMAVNVDNPAEVPFAAEYSAFGEMTVTSGASSNEWMPFGFAGGLYDADTELVRFGARDYDAVIGRWTAKDLMRFEDGTNAYVYARQDPINLRDATGKESCEDQLAASVSMCQAGCGWIPDYTPSLWEQVKLMCGGSATKLATQTDILEKRRAQQDARYSCLSRCDEIRSSGKAQCDAQEPDGDFGTCNGSGCLVMF